MKTPAQAEFYTQKRCLVWLCAIFKWPLYRKRCFSYHFDQKVTKLGEKKKKNIILVLEHLNCLSWPPRRPHLSPTETFNTEKKLISKKNPKKDCGFWIFSYKFRGDRQQICFWCNAEGHFKLSTITFSKLNVRVFLQQINNFKVRFVFLMYLMAANDGNLQQVQWWKTGQTIRCCSTWSITCKGTRSLMYIL